MGTTGTLTRAALAAAAVALAAAGCGADASTSTAAGTTSEAGSSSFRGVTRPDPFQVGDVTLPDVTPGQEGTFAFKAPEGELLFVFFGYTNCPDVCPTTMSYYKAALNELGPEAADKLQAAMVAIDPERDTPEVMERFLSFYADNRHALRTTDPAELDAAEEAFGTTSSVTTNADGKVEVVHSGTAYLVDDQGTVLVELPFGVSVDDLVHDISVALEQIDG